jgi:arginyl-tRNA synthetase
MTVDQIRNALAEGLDKSGVHIVPSDVPLEFPADIAHGDYATGVALAKAREAGMSPRALAEKLVEAMGGIEGVEKISIAGPGFINFTLTPQAVAAVVVGADQAQWGAGSAIHGRTIMVEYTQPNPFKPFHIGHLMSNAIGESVSRLLENAGATVIRANYQGDVGPHVAKCLWGVQKLGADIHDADELGRAYAYGASHYEDDPAAKAEIDALNKIVYAHSDPVVDSLYQAGRAASLHHFEVLYKILGTEFDHYFFESETAPRGEAIVRAHPEVFVESDGALVFKGEEHGLHTRVFITSHGTPTYETKEIGLETLKEELYPQADTFIVTTAVEQKEYFAVVKAALALIAPEIARKLTHISHGMMRFASGKMSSRKGNVITGESLLTSLIEVASERAKDSRAENPQALAQAVAVAGIKFQILRGAAGKDIVYDEDRALSLEGDSGPYLQYAYARTQAIAEKAKATGVTPLADTAAIPNDVARLLVRFPAIAERSAREYAPHHVTQYLIELAGAFNSWYAQEHILDGTPAAAHKVALAQAVGTTLKRGLWLLGIPAPEKM